MPEKVKTSASKTIERPGRQTSNRKPPEIQTRNLMVLLGFGLITALIILLIFHTFYRIQYSATGIYYGFASQVFQGLIPYRDFSLEYPPLALVFFLIPRFFADQWSLFAILYEIEILIFAWLGLWVFYRIALRMGKAPWKLLTPYTVGVLAIGPIIGQQYDLFPAVMTLLSLYYFWLGKHKTSWVWLALGVLTKLYPAVLIPLYLIIYWRNRQIKPAVTGLAVFGLVCLVVLSPFLATGPQHLMSMVEYHSQRGLQIESIYSALLLLADKLDWTTVSIEFNFGSWNLAGGISEGLSRATLWIQAAVLLLCYFFIWTQVKAGKSQFTRLGAYVLLITVVLLLSSKVFSPQYIIWLLPAIPLIFSRWRMAIWHTFFLTGVLTYLIFPVCYFSLLAANTGAVVILVVRDLSLVLLAALAVVSLKSMKSSE